jgi:hypothetical protein
MSPESKRRTARLLPLGGLLLSSLMTPCSAQETPAPAAPAGDAAYAYKGGRDPFVPLAGQGAGSHASTGDDEPGEFNASALELSGILKTRTGRWAVVRDPGGASYMVREGKIYDSKRKAVPGYVGIVKEKTLVVIGPNNTVTELSLKKDDEDEK